MMKLSSLSRAAFLLGAASVFACSGSDSRTVRGRLDTSGFRLDRAYVVAIATTGERWTAPVADTGSFAIKVRPRSTVSLRFVNATDRAGTYDAFAVLVSTNAGARWFTIPAGDSIDLGVVRRSDVASAPLGLREAQAAGDETDAGDDADSDSEEDSSDDADSDADSDRTVQEDQALVCDLSGGSDLTEAQGENDILENVDSDGDGTVDGSDTNDQREPCACLGDDDGDSDADAENDADSDSDSDRDADGDSDGDSDSDCDSDSAGGGSTDADSDSADADSEGSGGASSDGPTCALTDEQEDQAEGGLETCTPPAGGATGEAGGGNEAGTPPPNPGVGTGGI